MLPWRSLQDAGMPCAALPVLQDAQPGTYPCSWSSPFPAALPWVSQQPEPQCHQNLAVLSTGWRSCSARKSALSKLGARCRRWISQLAETVGEHHQERRQFWLRGQAGGMSCQAGEARPTRLKFQSTLLHKFCLLPHLHLFVFKPWGFPAKRDFQKHHYPTTSLEFN